MNPFVPPSDAVVLDTGDLDVNGTVSAALEVIAEQAPELLP